MSTDNKKTVTFQITSHDKETTIKLIDGELPKVIVNSGSNYIRGCTEQCRYLAPLKILSYERCPQPINNKQ